MKKKFPFDRPRNPEQSTVGVRTYYRTFFLREWPHDDFYLRQLARESLNCQEMLYLMRECDA